MCVLNRPKVFCKHLKYKVLNQPQWDIFQTILRSMSNLARKKLQPHSPASTYKSQTHTANHFVHSLKKDKWNFFFFFFISNKPIKHFLITVRINKTRLELGTVCLSLNVKEKGLSGEKKAWSTLVLLQKIKRNRQNKSLSAYFLIKYTFWTSLKPFSSLGSFSDINTELRLRKS